MSEIDFRFFDRKNPPGCLVNCEFNKGSFENNSEIYPFSVPKPEALQYNTQGVLISGVGGIPYSSGILLDQNEDPSFTMGLNFYKFHTNQNLGQFKVNSTQAANLQVVETNAIQIGAQTWGEKMARFASNPNLATNNTWFNLVITYIKGNRQANANWKYYLNGVLGTTELGYNNNNNHPWTIFGYFGNGPPSASTAISTAHSRRMDDFFIIKDRVFSHTEVRQFYEQTKKI